MGEIISHKLSLHNHSKVIAPANSKMSKLLAVILFIGVLSSVLARFNPHEGPLLSPLTSFTFTVSTVTTKKKTSCFITTGEISQCRRKRGIEEVPSIVQDEGKLQILPSATYAYYLKI